MQNLTQKVIAYTIAAGGSQQLDLSLSDRFDITLPSSGTATITLTNVIIDKPFQIRFLYTGACTLTLFTTIHWEGGTVPTWTMSNGKWDRVVFNPYASGHFEGGILFFNVS